MLSGVRGSRTSICRAGAGGAARGGRIGAHAMARLGREGPSLRGRVSLPAIDGLKIESTPEFEAHFNALSFAGRKALVARFEETPEGLEKLQLHVNAASNRVGLAYAILSACPKIPLKLSIEEEEALVVKLFEVERNTFLQPERAAFLVVKYKPVIQRNPELAKQVIAKLGKSHSLALMTLLDRPQSEEEEIACIKELFSLTGSRPRFGYWPNYHATLLRKFKHRILAHPELILAIAQKWGIQYLSAQVEILGITDSTWIERRVLELVTIPSLLSYLDKFELDPAVDHDLRYACHLTSPSLLTCPETVFKGDEAVLSESEIRELLESSLASKFLQLESKLIANPHLNQPEEYLKLLDGVIAVIESSKIPDGSKDIFRRGMYEMLLSKVPLLPEKTQLLLALRWKAYLRDIPELEALLEGEEARYLISLTRSWSKSALNEAVVYLARSQKERFSLLFLPMVQELSSEKGLSALGTFEKLLSKGRPPKESGAYQEYVLKTFLQLRLDYPEFRSQMDGLMPTLRYFLPNLPSSYWRCFEEWIHPSHYAEMPDRVIREEVKSRAMEIGTDLFLSLHGKAVPAWVMEKLVLLIAKNRNIEMRLAALETIKRVLDGSPELGLSEFPAYMQLTCLFLFSSGGSDMQAIVRHLTKLKPKIKQKYNGLAQLLQKTALEISKSPNPTLCLRHLLSILEKKLDVDQLKVELATMGFVLKFDPTFFVCKQDGGSKTIQARQLELYREIFGQDVSSSEALRHPRVAGKIELYFKEQSTRREMRPILREFITSVLSGTFNKMRYQPQRSKHLALLARKWPEVFEKWQKGDEVETIQGGFTVQDTDDWMDLFSCGTEVEKSCLSVYGAGRNNKQLMAPVSDGKIRMICVKDLEGKIVGRVLMRLLVNEKHEPVLYVEKYYGKPAAWIRSAIDAKVRKRAEELSVPFYVTYPGEILHSLDSPAPYENVDGMREKTEGTYVIRPGALKALEDRRPDPFDAGGLPDEEV